MKLVVSDFDLTFFDSNYEENIKLINSFVQKGNMFVIATGRSFELLKKDIKNKNIDFKYLICSDGSVVFDKIVINKIIEQLQNDTNLRFLDIDANVFGISAIYAIFNSMEYAEKVLNGFLNKYEVSGYVSTHGIKIINKNISKVSGIEYIRNIINIEEDNIYTIGDRINDLEMIDKYNGYLIGKDVHNFKEFIEMIDN